MEQPERLVEMMGSCNIESMVHLDGRWGRELEDNLDRYDRAYPDRFFTFCHVDWRLLDEPNGPDLLAESLQRSVMAGARGLKVWKDLGLKVQRHGRTVLPDDPMLSSLWEMAGTLGVPVLIHTADPFAFFLPVDRHNERLEELLRYSHMVSRRRPGRDDFHRLIDGVEHVIASHAKTNFVAAHGFYAENLGRVSTMMDTYANFSVDIAWAHLQFGRQPRTARDLIVKHPDRVLFGTDVFPLRPGIFPVYFRFLETADEAFSYTDEAVPRSGRWLIYGLDLPQPVLDKVYRDNAKRLLHLK
jgi:predicted TIM-barrel fold metal-dependent hydrolase